MKYVPGSVLDITPDNRWSIEISAKNDDGEQFTWNPEFVGWATVVDFVDGESGEIQTTIEPVFLEDGTPITISCFKLYMDMKRLTYSVERSSTKEATENAWE